MTEAILTGAGAIGGALLIWLGQKLMGFAGKGATVDLLKEVEKNRAEGDSKLHERIDDMKKQIEESLTEMDSVHSVNYNSLDKQLAIVTDRQQNTAKVLDEVRKEMHEIRGEMRSNTENIIGAISKLVKE
ncbi:MAG: hypothetical protein CMF59_12580 [Leptospiraceae bacterium]|nr:hypothetical protein [Leptospiraceae bacterium]